MRRLLNFRSHVTLRVALLLAAGASLAMLGVALGLRTESGRQLKTLELELRSNQRKLEKNVETFRESDAAAKSALEERLRQMSARQAAIGSETTAAVQSPFSIDALLGAIVEIVCIDNNDKDVFFSGSGTVVEKGGLVVTNQHILLSDDGSLIRYCGVGFTSDLKDPPQIDYIAATAAIHDQADLALLRITEQVKKRPLPVFFPAVSVSGSSAYAESLRLGDPIYIGGYPGIGAETFTFTQGVVSGRVGKNFIKTSALIDTGTSGGAAFDSYGRFIGVPTAAAKGEIGGSLGYLIGADVVEDFLSDYAAGKNLLAPSAKEEN